MSPGILAAIGAVSIFAMTLGLTYPLLALILEAAGHSETFIGLNSAMVPVGILASSPLVPRAATRINAVTLAMTAGAATALLMLAFAIVENAAVWFVLRFLLGVAINLLWVLSETWINQLAPTKARGRIMGIYATAISGGFAIGPVVVAMVGANYAVAFAISIAGTLAILAILFANRRHLPSFPPAESGGIGAFARAAPILLVGVGAIGLFDQTTLSLMPIYGLRSGFGEAEATLALGVLVAGNVMLQVPIGWLADLWSRRGVFIALALAVVVCACLLPATTATWLFWPLVFVWGATGYGAYTVALSELGDRFSGAALVAGNAACASMWGLGGIIGPASAGAVMDAAGPIGLPLVLGLVFAGLALAAIRWPLVRTGALSATRPADMRAGRPGIADFPADR